MENVSANAYGARELLDGLPGFSPNAIALLQAAEAEARRRGHTRMGTEHLLWSLLQEECEARVKPWIGSAMVATAEDDPHWERDVMARLERNPAWAPAETNRLPEDAVLEPTGALQEVYQVVRQFASGPVRDGEQGVRIVDGLVAAEFLVAAILLHGVNVAAEMLARCSRGRVNSWTVFEAMGIDPNKVHVERKALLPITELSRGEISVSTPFVLGASPLPDPTSLPEPPTECSNWLIPGHLAIGEMPSAQDALDLSAAGVTTFVSLIGEYTTDKWLNREYPMSLTQKQKPAHFVHFPVRDFDVPLEDELQAIVLHLKLLLTQGEMVYVHCRGGHGRTGTVVIPLMAALFDMDDGDATRYVCQATSSSRPSDRGWRVEMPETGEQEAATRSVNSGVRLTRSSSHR
eukprot:TRINITY_DN17273_c0_g1_i1.p1 TRINITY_DN17273_c0_g1~~TRINITY_DN17273_c0_g1_i1.p1  ORF type:complete len:405 (+),score=80.96 TRINITY_DN17273_c0_g1_i1:170-1384(+)